MLKIIDHWTFDLTPIPFNSPNLSQFFTHAHNQHVGN
jgi:hypothetical protein